MKIHKLIKFCMLPLLLFGLLFSHQTSVRADDHLVIGGLKAPPYIIVDEDQEVRGILIDLLTEAFEQTGITPVFKITNWARAFDSAKFGHIDALIPTIKSPDREEFLVYPDTALATLEMVFLKNTEKPIKYNGDIEKVSHLSFGAIRHARVAPHFDQARNSGLIKVQERNSFGLLAMAVARNRIDLMAGDKIMALWGAANNGVIDQIEPLSPPLAKVPVYLAVSKKSRHATRIDEISKALNTARSSQKFKSALESYSKLIKTSLHESLTTSVKSE